MSLADISGSSSELSSRHIPDIDTLSNCSFSFQIPGTEAGDNLLASDDENDFFINAGGADISLALTHPSEFSPVHMTPADDERKKVEDPILGFLDARSSTPENIAGPLISPAMDTLSQKPKSSSQRPKLSLNIRPVIQAIPTSPMTSFSLPTHEPFVSTANDPVDSNRPFLESKPAVAQDSIQIPDEPETKTRPTRKKFEIKAEEQEVKKKRTLRTQRKIVEGGITKSRIAVSKKPREVPSRDVASSASPFEAIHYSAPSLPGQPLLTQDPGAEALLADASSSSIFPLTGIAGRLIQYGQKYMDTFRGQTETDGPPEKLTVNLDHSSSVVQKKIQEQSEVDSSRLADGQLQCRQKSTDTYSMQIETDFPTQKTPVDFDFASEPKNEDASIIQNATQERNELDADDEIEDDPSKPLTLSQLSPRKEQTQKAVTPPMTISSTASEVPAPSTTRLGTKRPITAESTSEEPKLKRSKGDEPKIKERSIKPVVSKGNLNSKPRVPSGRSQPQSRKPSATQSGSISSSKTSSSSIAVVAPKPAGIRRTRSRVVSGKQATIFNPGRAWNDDVQLPEKKDMRQSNSSLKSSASGVQNLETQNGKMIIPPFKCTDSQGASQQTEATLEDSNSRSTSRSQSSSQSHKHKFYHPAPNFKVMHAAFNASLAQRKENIHPTVPLPMRWETESRMQERKKFDERLKEKEREKEIEEEERRRLREAEEEMELKELRKKMVVKAHEVPEWYNARPKTRKGQEQDVEN